MWAVATAQGSAPLICRRFKSLETCQNGANGRMAGSIGKLVEVKSVRDEILNGQLQGLALERPEVLLKIGRVARGG